MAISPATLEGRTFILDGFGQVKLAAQLGSGRLSQVFRGESPEKGAVAVKIAGHDLDETMSESFRSEFKTLEALRATAQQLAQQGSVKEFAASYFPEPLSFVPEYRTGDGSSYSIVVMELVQADKLIDLAVARPDHVLEESSGLKTAIQYAEMLQVLHAAGYTASDRKIDDIYWRNGDAGPLIVLDWNVVGRGATGVADDFLRFGSFWYEFLVGRPPTYANVGSKRVARPDARPEWQKLSRGTRSILQRSLHPVPQKQYQSAQALKNDLIEQLDLWNSPLDELVFRLEGSSAELPSIALLDMIRRRGHKVDEMNERIEALDKKDLNDRLDNFYALVNRIVKMGANHGR
jgi:serine/threonine protein kinase